jgi:protein ImuB
MRVSSEPIFNHRLFSLIFVIMFACIYAQKLPADLSLVDFAYGFSPVVEETKTGTVVIDVEGCELLFGSAYQLANEVAQRAKKPRMHGGLEGPVSVAIAANPDTAIQAATHLPGVTFVSPGEEQTCLGEFPLERLDHSLINIEKKIADEILETLRLWGIRSFAAFASLPVAGVSERLGQAGIKLQQLAAGKTERHLKLKQPEPVFTNSLELDHAITELEPLSFIFGRLLHQLCAALHSYALASNELSVSMQLEDRTLHERKLSLPYPMRDHKVFLKLLLLDTEMHPPPAAVRSVSIACEPVKPRVLQSGLFVPLSPAPDKLELTLARIAKLVGEQNVGSATLLDTHRPDAFTLKRFTLQTDSGARKRRKTRNRQLATGNQQCLGFRMFRPPLRAIVQAEQGWPKQISAWSKQRSVYGKVVSLAGPWRTTGDWWRPDCWARDEWDVTLERQGQQTIYRIYREFKSENWFVEGNYD